METLNYTSPNALIEAKAGRVRFTGGRETGGILVASWGPMIQPAARDPSRESNSRGVDESAGVAAYLGLPSVGLIKSCLVCPVRASIRLVADKSQQNSDLPSGENTSDVT